MNKKGLLVWLIAMFWMGSQSWVWGAIGNPKAAKGGSFYYNIGGQPNTLNPLTSTDAYAANVHGYVLESLMIRNIETWEWEPGLAEKQSTSGDGLVFTYKLREGVKWHDGKPLTPEDIKFSFDAIFDPDYNTSHLRPYYENIDKVEIVDEKTIKFTAKKKYFGNLSVVNGLEVIPMHLYSKDKKNKKLNKLLVGTGPYTLEQWQKGKRIVLKKNATWWGLQAKHLKGVSNYEKIILRFIKEQDIQLEMMKKGDLDFIGLSPESYTKKAVGDPWGKTVLKVRTQNKAPVSFGFIGWNLRKGIFQDRKVRVAMAHLMNRKLMNEKFRFNMSHLATGPWYLQSDYASKKIKPFEFDLKKGIALLKEAGWQDSDKDGFLDKTVDGKKVKLSFTLLNPSQDFMKYLTIYKEDAKKAGVEINLKYLEWNTFSKLLHEQNFDAIAMAWGGGSPDLDPKQIWHSDSQNGGSNYIGYSNTEVDQLIDKGRETLNRKKRIKIFKQVYEKIAQDAPYLFLFNDKNVLYAHSSRVKKQNDTYQYSIGRDFWWMEPAK